MTSIQALVKNINGKIVLHFPEAGPEDAYDLATQAITCSYPEEFYKSKTDNLPHVWIHFADEKEQEKWAKIDKAVIKRRLFPDTEEQQHCNSINWTSPVQKQLATAGIKNLNKCTAEQWVQNPEALKKILLKAVISHIPDTEVCAWLEKFKDFIGRKEHISFQEDLIEQAITSGNLLIVKKLLDLEVMSPTQKFQDIDAKPLAPTPLHFALNSSHIEIATLLIDTTKKQGQDPFAIKDSNDKTIIDHLKEPIRSWFNTSWDPHPPYLFHMDMRRMLESRIDDKAIQAEVIRRRHEGICNEAKKDDPDDDIPDWLEVRRAIQEGFDLIDSSSVFFLSSSKSTFGNVLFKNCLDDGQYDLAHQLLEKGFVNAIDDDTIKMLLMGKHSSLSNVLLDSAIKNGILTKDWIESTDFLVTTALEKPDYPLAAFLMFLGAPLAQNHPDYEALKHYADILKKTHDAQDPDLFLMMFLNAKNIAHLVGDSFIGHMKDDCGEKLEGNSSFESLAFFCSALNSIKVKDASAQAKIALLATRLENAGKLSLCIQGICALPSDEAVSSAINDLEDDIFKKLENLQPNSDEASLIPAQWKTNNGAHAILIECKKLNDGRLLISVINTGEGAEYGGGSYDGSRLHIKPVARYVMSLEQLKDTDVLYKVLQASVCNKKDADYGPKDICEPLEPYSIDTAEMSEHFAEIIRKAQLSGTCSLRCLLAYAKIVLEDNPGSYKEFKELFSQKVVELTVDLNEKLLGKQPQLMKVLTFAEPKLYHSLMKRLEHQGDVPEVEAKQRLDKISAGLQKGVPEAASSHEPVPLDPSFATCTKDFELKVALKVAPHHAKATAGTVSESGVVRARTSCPANEITQVATINELEGYLAQVSAYVQENKEAKEQNERYLSTILISLGKAFLPGNNNTDPLSKVVTDLADDPESSDKLIATVFTLTDMLSTSFYPAHKNDRPARYIAIQYALVMSWEISKKIEEKLKYHQGEKISNYGLNFNAMKEWKRNANLQTHTLLEADLESDLQLLLQYGREQERAAKAQNKKPHTNGLLNFFSQGMGRGDITYGSFSLKSFTSYGDKPSYQDDYDYARAHYLKQVRNIDWREADEEFINATKEVREKNKIVDVDLVEWRTHWLYLREMPPHFTYLRKLAFLALQIYTQSSKQHE